MLSRGGETCKFLLHSRSVSLQARIIVELLIEEGVRLVEFVACEVVQGAEHYAVCNRDLITGDKPCVFTLQLLLEALEEWPPLVLHERCVQWILLRSSVERQVNACDRCQELGPRIHNPVDLNSLAPVVGIVVSLLDTDCS